MAIFSLPAAHTSSSNPYTCLPKAFALRGVLLLSNIFSAAWLSLKRTALLYIMNLKIVSLSQKGQGKHLPLRRTERVSSVVGELTRVPV